MRQHKPICGQFDELQLIGVSGIYFKTGAVNQTTDTVLDYKPKGKLKATKQRGERKTKRDAKKG